MGSDLGAAKAFVVFHNLPMYYGAPTNSETVLPCTCLLAHSTGCSAHDAALHEVVTTGPFCTLLNERVR